MEILFVVSFIIALTYVATISGIMVSWLETPEWQAQLIHKPTLKVSIIIAARNEEQHINQCLIAVGKSIDKLHHYYQNQDIECIVIDDHSTDQTAAKVHAAARPDLLYLALPDHLSGKKAAIRHGVQHSKGDILVMTDADCIVNEEWLATVVSYMDRSQSAMITSLVLTEPSYRLSSHWQYLDLAAMMATTAHGLYRGSYSLGNGANLAVRREVYLEVESHLDGKQYASGDDVFLIQAVKHRYPDSVKMLKSPSAIVLTSNEATWRDILIQRKRWASKTKGYAETGVIKLQGYVWSYCVLIIISLLAAPLTDGLSVFTGVLLLMVKATMDYMLLSRLCTYLGYRRPLKYFIPLTILHMAYILYAGVTAILPTSYIWKGRRVS